ncbi:MAG: hypothetical protein NTW19_04165 [Planctomycetota bacterium]|nr:hypothetical protein [Planctomycetota bacterium]
MAMDDEHGAGWDADDSERVLPLPWTFSPEGVLGVPLDVPIMLHAGKRSWPPERPHGPPAHVCPAAARDLTAKIYWFSEAVFYLGLDRQYADPGQKLRALVRGRKIRTAGKMGRHVYFAKTELDRFLDGGERSLPGRRPKTA